MCLALPALVRQAGKMPQPLWDSDALLRRGALWRDADQVLTTRAMTRCALAGGWIVLAAGQVTDTGCRRRPAMSGRVPG